MALGSCVPERKAFLAGSSHCKELGRHQGGDLGLRRSEGSGLPSTSGDFPMMGPHPSSPESLLPLHLPTLPPHPSFSVLTPQLLLFPDLGSFPGVSMPSLEEPRQVIGSTLQRDDVALEEGKGLPGDPRP